MSWVSIDEDTFCQRVLNKCQGRFVSDTEPTSLLDKLLETETFDYDQYRDIDELTRTSDKNREILRKIRRKGKRGYTNLKQCLIDSMQSHIVDHIEKEEIEVKAKVEAESVQEHGNSRQLADADLAFISSCIGQNWEILGLSLGLTQIQIDHLTKDYPTTLQRISRMLSLWKEQINGGDASFHQLMAIFKTLPAVNIDFHGLNEHFSTQSVDFDDQPRKILQGVPKVGGSKTVKHIDQPLSTLRRQDTTDHVIEEECHLHPQNATDIESYKNYGTDQVDAEVSGAHALSPSSANVPSYKDTGKHIEGFIDGHHIKITTPYKGLGKDTLNGHLHEKPDNVVSVNKNGRADAPRDYSCDDIQAELGRTFGDSTSSSYTATRTCTHDGRLVALPKKYFDLLKKYCNKNKHEGGFGTVYLSDEKISKLGIKVAVKEINCREDNDRKSQHYKNSTHNEKLASRLMHFAIVPLLGIGSDNGMVWLLYPRLDKGDLHTLIERDTKCIDENHEIAIELDKKRRLKILYHINAAIDFLHTEIENFRGKIIHLDIKSSNVVLDVFYNARLTDFGVARETFGEKSSIYTSHTAIPITNGYFEPPTYDKLETYFDYFNVGVVIRELLTGKPPCFKSESKELRLKDLDDYEIEALYIQEPVWEVDGEFCGAVDRLLVLSRRCIDSASSREVQKDTEQLSSKEIVTECQNLVKEFCNCTAWERQNSKSQTLHDNNCEMCMVNPSVSCDILSHEDCNQCIKVCVSCMRNSYLNPIRCHSCFKVVNPVIGHRWGALCIAGQFEDKSLSKLCQEDIEDIKKVIISKWPLVMGIREEFVKSILSSSQDCANTKNQIRDAITSFEKEELNTILIYYTGLYTKENGFFLENDQDESGSRQERVENQYMTLMEFQEMLRPLSNRKLIVILDCPEAPMLCSTESDISRDADLVQLNCCKSHQTYSEDFAKKRLFKKAFIQGLTMTSTQEECFLQNQLDKKCDICPIDGRDFVTIGNLEGYISRHITALKTGEQIEPVHYASRGGWIGYLGHNEDKVKFTLVYNGREKDCTIPCNFFNNIVQLKEVLFDEFIDQMKIDREKGRILQLKAKRYYDILRLVIKSGPKQSHKRELFKLEQVLSAWNGKRDLYVEIRQIANIEDGMVGVFRTDDNDKYFSYLENWKHELIEEDDEFVYKVDLNSFLKQKKTNPEQLYKALLPLKRTKPNSELHITVLRSKDHLGVYTRREDFLCFRVLQP